MKCATKSCKWLGKDGKCRLFAGDAAAECNYRVEPGKAPAKPTTSKEGKK